MTTDPDRRRADLHIHTLASDGADSVAEVLEESRRAGLAAISITDHDSVEAVGEAISLGPDFGLEIVPGIEISVELDDTEMHLLGYFIDHKDRQLQARLAYLRNVRSRRAVRMLEILAGMGFPLDMEALLPGQMTGSIGRLHIAQALARAGYVRTPAEAFARYIGNGGPAYVPKLKLEVEEAMKMILKAGGAPVLAHPGQLNRDELIPDLVDRGLVGLEVYYPSHNRLTVNHYEELARHYGLLATGGSDSHGRNKENTPIGAATVPYAVVGRLRDRATSPLTPDPSPQRGEGNAPSPREPSPLWGEGNQGVQSGQGESPAPKEPSPLRGEGRVRGPFTGTLSPQRGERAG